MIILNLTRKNNSGHLLRYIMRYILDAEKQSKDVNYPKETFIIRHNIRSRSMEGYIREFQSVEAHRKHKRSNQPAIHHAIISWSNKDSHLLSNAMLRDMTKQYIQLRGNKNLYLGTVHRDKSHLHIHLAISATQLNGKANRLSKKEFSVLKEKLTLYQQLKYPQLENSLPEHGKKIKMSKENAADFIKTKQFTKAGIWEDVKKIQKQAKSSKSFLESLKMQGYVPYFRGADKTVTGIVYGGKKYRFKTLGLDIKDVPGINKENIQSDNNLTSIKKLRQRVKENEIEKTELIKEAHSIKSLIRINRVKGFGEVSPYEAFQPATLSLDR